MSLGDLMVKVGADISNWASSMEEVKDSAAETMASVRESMAAMGESIVEFAEKAELEVGKVSSAFGGLGALLGGGIIVGALSSMLEEDDRAGH